MLKNNEIQQTELKLQQTCFLWHWNTRIQQRGRLFMIHNNPENSIKGAQLKGAGLRKGIADFIYLLPYGKYLFIEMKQDAKQSIFQKWFEKCINQLSGNYIVLFSFEEFKEKITAIESLEIASGLNVCLPLYPIVESR